MKSSKTRLLVVDDDRSLRSTLCTNLEHAGYEVLAAEGAAQALKLLQCEAVELILTDLKMPGADGIAFIRKCQEAAADADIVLMTGFGSATIAIEAIRAGAQDYIAKPFTNDELLLTLRKLEERRKLIRENSVLKGEVEQRYNFSNIVAQSKAMKDVFDTVRRLANFNTTVLIRGESGTGKELLARAFHHNSPRRGKAFVAINCAAIPENLMESELFGHKKGAFTDATRDKPGLFFEANGGTIFLDEIGEMPPHLQVKILRVLQEQQIQRVGDESVMDIDVRVIAATLRDLERDVQEGRFRDDLYYRLNVVAINIPPLRERTEDIPVLVEHFLKKYNRKLGLNIKGVETAAHRCLLKYGWRGNVRELENCIERAMVLADGETIDLAALPDHIRKLADGAAAAAEEIDPDNLSIKQRTRVLERDLIVRALTKTGGNRTRAAKVLEISHRALLYKLKEFGLEEFGKGAVDAD